MSHVLQCTGLTKNYGAFRALDGLSFSLPEGRIVGLLGPNGSGKTTFIKIAAGLLTPGTGTVTIDGKVPGPETKGIVSYLPERTYLSEWMTAEQVIRFFADFYPDFDAQRAREMMQRLGVRLDARIKSMSKGTKEKVQLILVMSRRARLYLLDEPIGGVDPAARDYILNTIIGNYAENATVIISTHLIADVEKVLDEVIFLSNGKAIFQGTVDDIREREGKSVDALFREVFKC
ncbi:MAG: ABC transporter ATP-binding protein [Clostridia bacterium]|nr:ABC transporter ATP-binding protein [Clostridia bacterium]